MSQVVWLSCSGGKHTANHEFSYSVLYFAAIPIFNLSNALQHTMSKPIAILVILLVAIMFIVAVVGVSDGFLLAS